MVTLEDLFTFQSELLQLLDDPIVEILKTKGGVDIPTPTTVERTFLHLPAQGKQEIDLPNGSKLIDFHCDGSQHVGTVVQMHYPSSDTAATFRLTYAIDKDRELRSINFRYWVHHGGVIQQVGKSRMPPSGQFRVQRKTPQSFSIDGGIESYRHYEGKVRFVQHRSGSAPKKEEVVYFAQPVFGNFHSVGKPLDYDTSHAVAFESERVIDYGTTIAQLAQIMQKDKLTKDEVKGLEHLKYLHFR